MSDQGGGGEEKRYFDVGPVGAGGGGGPYMSGRGVDREDDDDEKLDSGRDGPESTDGYRDVVSMAADRTDLRRAAAMFRFIGTAHFSTPDMD